MDRRTRLSAAAGVICLFVLSACGSGLNAPTNRIYQAAAGADHRGDVWSLNTLFVANSDGSATLSASMINKTGHAQELEEVSVTNEDGDSLDVETSGLPQELSKQQTQRMGLSDTPIILISKDATPGRNLTLKLSFSHSADATFKVPVHKRTATYSKIRSSTDED